MKRILTVTLIFISAVALASWQQHSIWKIRCDIERLCAELEKARSALSEEQMRLTRAEERPRQSPAMNLSKNADETQYAPPPGPEVEGWWPANQPYFYLRKDLLPFVRFNDIDRTPEEVRASGLEFRADTDYSIENRLFTQDKLNEQMVKLLGMTPAERASVERVYNDLRREVREMEAAKIQPLNPPETVDNTRVVIARLPSLAADLEPLLDEARNTIQNTLGPKRSELLFQQAEQYFNRYCDGLGSAGREFVLNGQSLSVTYSNSWGKSAKQTAFFCPPGRSDPWEYGHLFNAGSPCEIKPRP